MIFPPIIVRELRVAARCRSTYWTRFGIAAAAIGLGGAIDLFNLGEPQELVGPFIFIGMSVLAFVYTLFAGRTFTADCLSSEKRDGTLGLLFLTDLKGHDVVFGKLAATSLNGFLGLLALVPILAVPLMMGGITAGEFWRVVLVLVNTFFFSLALGMFTSAICRDQRRALGLNVALLLSFTLFLPGALLLIVYLAGAPQPPVIIGYLTPAFPFALAFDETHRGGDSSLLLDFWISCGLIHLLGWLFIGLASHVVPNSWQDRPLARVNAPAKKIDPYSKPGNRETRAAYRKRLLDINAFYWLASRNRFKPLQVWIFLACMGGWWIWGWLSSGEWFDYPIIIGLTLLLNITLKLWILIEAGQRLAEDQRAGALELLLSTPLTARDIVRGQFLALRRQFLKPLVMVVVVQLVFGAAVFRPSLRDSAPQTLTFIAFSIILLGADALAASWVAMQLALITRGPQRTATGTFLRILVLPWIGYGAVSIAVNLAFFLLDIRGGNTVGPGWFGQLALWFGFGIIVDLWFGVRARRQLLMNFRALATEAFRRKRAVVAE